MAVFPAGVAHLKGIEQLIKDGRHLYLSSPNVDISALLAQQTSVVGITDNALWGFASVECETRLTTSNEPAISRAYISYVALTQGRSPFMDVPALVNALLALAAQPSQNMVSVGPQADNSILFIYYGHQRWLVKPLEQAGFSISQRVEFLRLDRLQQRVLPADDDYKYFIRPATAPDLEAIAALDTKTFPPLWHFGLPQLNEVWKNHRVCIAMHEDKVIGYTAMSLANVDSQDGRSAYLTRIATLPTYRGKGVGRQLLLDCLQFAKKKGMESVVLNTQTDNEPARRLYQGVGFSRTGQSYPVLTRLLTSGNY